MSRSLRTAAVIVGSSLLLAAILEAGFRLELGHFGSNLVAELAGVVASVVVAVLVIERLIDRDRRARWGLVEAQTLKTLRFTLVKGALPLYLHLHDPRPPEANPYGMYQSEPLDEKLRNLAAALREREDKKLKPDPLRPVLESIAPHINFIRDSVMQRLLTVGAEPELIRRLALLESTFEDLDFAAWLDENLNSRPGENAQRLGTLADSMRDVVAYLD
jgi:hypothetical protein